VTLDVSVTRTRGRCDRCDRANVIPCRRREGHSRVALLCAFVCSFCVTLVSLRDVIVSRFSFMQISSTLSWRNHVSLDCPVIPLLLYPRFVRLFLFTNPIVPLIAVLCPAVMNFVSSRALPCPCSFVLVLRPCPVLCEFSHHII
jgi:hypothetical protein